MIIMQSMVRLMRSVGTNRLRHLLVHVQEEENLKLQHHVKRLLTPENLQGSPAAARKAFAYVEQLSGTPAWDGDLSLRMQQLAAQGCPPVRPGASGSKHYICSPFQILSWEPR